MSEHSKMPYDKLIMKSITKGQEELHKRWGENDVPHVHKTKIPEKPNTTSIKDKKIQVKIFVGKDCQIVVKPSCKQIALILSKLNDARYDVKNNQWTFKAEDYKFVEKEFLTNKIQFDKIPPGTLTLAMKTIKTDVYPFEGGIFDCLMGFQRDSLNFAINRNGRILLADDMGLGKTIQALAIAAYYRIEFPLLIITPASLCYSWYEAVNQFLNADATIIREKSDLGGNISIISYSIAVNLITSLSNIKYGIVICDECHYLKSSTTKRTKLLLPILQRTQRLVMISGTPATSRPLELYPILSALDKNLFPTFAAYGNRYCDARKNGMFIDYRGCSNAIELNTVLEKAFMIRRLKEDVLSELPKKFRRQVLLDTNGRMKELQHKGELLSDIVDSTIMMEYKEAACIKKDPVIKYLEGMVEKNIKSLIFAHHKEMLDAIEEFCKQKHVKYIRIDGATQQGKRQAYVDQFQRDEDVRMAVLSLTAASTGLTLTAGKAVVFAELYWNPGVMLQAEDRIHRIGQIDSVDIHYLVARNTIDETVWPKLLKKLTVLESLGISKNELKLVKGTEVGEIQQQRLDFRKI